METSVAGLSILSAALAALLVEAGVVGAHIGAVQPMAGLVMFLSGVALAIVALPLGLIGLGSGAENRSAKRKAVAGILLGLLICVPVGFTMWRWWSTACPNISDVTTDCDNPPEFVNPPGLSPKLTKYDRVRLEPIQKKYYPKFGPLRLDENPGAAFASVRVAANVPPLAGLQIAGQIPSAPGWFITYINPATRTIEGVDSSYLFRFRDDFVIQVRSGPEPDTSLVEMRSRSRDGICDFGANYNRVREFFAMLKLDSDLNAKSRS